MIAEEAVRRIDSLLDEAPLEQAIVLKNPTDASIKFEHVTFTYAGNKEPTLADISFTVPQGKTFALVGSSGGGKSTVASLIPRFHDVDSGCVKIGNVDVRLIEGKKLMDQVSFVFQSADLFKTSILDNIRAAKPDASHEAIMKAVNAAQCGDVLAKLPDNIDTVIGTKGVYLSGGEKQRVALARAVLKDAPIIVLDEATAFTDPENEHKIQLAFEELTKGKTVLMIAHRLSTVQNADRILVVDKGKIAEQGTHKDLLSQKGIYASMWEEYRRSISWNVGKGKSYVS
jgi:ATP-binding cassette subfamily B protein